MHGELAFDVELEWSGSGRSGVGRAETANVVVAYAAPESMGGCGVGASPEDLLVAAVASCYSATLFGVLRRAGLRAAGVRVSARGVVTGYPTATAFARLLVAPTIVGGDPARVQEYVEAARAARDRCFIGKTIAGNVAYEVGEVTVAPTVEASAA